ncbi:hypothetical protein C9154_18280, partial [Escherichia coli]
MLPETQFYEVCFSIVIRTGSQFKRVSLYSEVLPHYSNAVIQNSWICPYISRHLLSLNPLQARCRRYSRG